MICYNNSEINVLEEGINMESVRELATKYHDEGYNCAESVVKVSNETMQLHLPDEAIRMVSVLGGGVGGSGCICGALSGACLVLGALVGRVDKDEKTKPEMNAPIKEFHNRWVNHFHASCCRVLKSPANGGPVSCGDLIAETAEMLDAYVTEKGLRK